MKSNRRKNPFTAIRAFGESPDPGSHGEYEGVALTAKEFDILALLVRSPRQIFTAEQIYEAAWNSSSLEGDVRTIMVYISNLRKKIEENPSKPNFIISIRGVGYKLNHSLLDSNQ